MAFDRDRGNRGRRDSGGGRFDRPREMTKVTCSNCGKETEVPFKPTGDRPVYCRDCFAKMDGGDRRDNRDSRPPFKKFDDQRSQGPSNNVQLSEINSKLDQLIKLLSPKEEVKIVEPVPAKEKKIVKKKVLKKVVKAPIETPEE